MRPSLTAYGASLAAVAVAVVARLLLEPLLADRLPFATLFLAVGFAAWYGGRRPGLLALVAGAVAATAFIIQPRYSFAIDQTEFQVGLVLYGVVGFASIAMFESLRKAHRQAAEQAERLRTTLASIGDAVITTNLDGRVTNMNAVAEELTGWVTGEAMGQPLDAVFRIVNETSRRTVENPVTRALREGVIVGLANHTVLIAKDGKERPIDDSAAPIRCVDGEIVGCVLVFRDITERHRHEAALRESEQFTRSVLFNVFSFVGVMTVDGTLTDANRSSLESAGIPASEVLGKKFWDCYWWSYSPEIQAQLRDACVRAAGGEVVRYDVPVRMAGGTLVWIDFQVSPLCDTEGRITHLIPSALDIAARHAAEETVSRQFQELDALYSTTQAGLFQFDADLRFVRVNAWTAAINGLSIEAHIGRTLNEVLNPEAAGTVERLLRQVMQTGEPIVELEVHGAIAARDDERDWLVSYHPVRGADGEVAGVHGVVLDITERKQSEAAMRISEIRFRRVFEAAKDGILILDGQTGQITDANPYILEALGLTRAEALDRELWEIGVFTDATASRAAMAELQTRGYVRYEDLPLESKTGQRREVEVVANVYQENGQRVIQCNIRDITERKKLQDQLKGSADELQRFANALSESDRRKNEFIATLAHELRNPLAPIRNGLQLIKLSGANGTVERARSMMERQVTQMVRLVDDLLDISRVTQGKIELRKQRVEVRAVIDAAVETSLPLIEQAGHELVVAVPDEPVFLDGDPTRLAQVVSNLLTNSAKYTHPGGHIRLNARRDGEAVAVSVADDGIGIPPAMLDQVFVMFAQVDRALEKTTGGLGIGLSLVKGLVEMHGGTIVARSEGEGRGSEFVVRLPVAGESVVPSKGVEDGSTALKSSLRILIVDDNRDGADSLSMMLQIMGNDTRTAYDGREGVDVAEAFRPDVVLFDIGMPKLNGYEACRLIREQPWGTGVTLIAVTGWGQDEHRHRSREAGFDHHLVKPVDPHELMKLLAGFQTA